MGMDKTAREGRQSDADNINICSTCTIRPVVSRWTALPLFQHNSTKRDANTGFFGGLFSSSQKVVNRRGRNTIDG
jgi:hypothetical protein